MKYTEHPKRKSVQHSADDVDGANDAVSRASRTNGARTQRVRDTDVALCSDGDCQPDGDKLAVVAQEVHERAGEDVGVKLEVEDLAARCVRVQPD